MTAAATSAGARPTPPTSSPPPSPSPSTRHYPRNPSPASCLRLTLCCNFFTQIPSGASRSSLHVPSLLLTSLLGDLKCLSWLLILLSRPHLMVATPDGCCVASVIIHTYVHEARALHLPANLGSTPSASAVLILSSSPHLPCRNPWVWAKFPSFRSFLGQDSCPSSLVSSDFYFFVICSFNHLFI